MFWKGVHRYIPPLKGPIVTSMKTVVRHQEDPVSLLWLCVHRLSSIQRKMPVCSSNGAVRHLTLGKLRFLCGDTMHALNIALAVVALPLTTLLVILFSSWCHQNHSLFNLNLSSEGFLFYFLVFCYLFLNTLREWHLPLLCLALFGLHRGRRVTWMWNCKVKSAESREDYRPPVDSFLWLITQNQQRCTVKPLGQTSTDVPNFNQDKPLTFWKLMAPLQHTVNVVEWKISDDVIVVHSWFYRCLGAGTIGAD